MKKILFYLFAGVSSTTAFSQDTTLLSPVEVRALRATDLVPVVKTNLTAEDIQKQNISQDLPFILQFTPGLEAFSDAGNGIGYTGLRLRGSDATRINFTINGIPYNDAESQSTFLVNIPDLASSAGSIQIQRGIGTSSQGAGSFGGGVHISTNEIDPNQSFQFQHTLGSYGTIRNTAKFNSGILKKHWLIDARLSHIQSDGYIDRASTRLGAGHLSLVWKDKKQSFRFNYIHGKEKTYQAWNGIDEETLKTDRTYNSSGTEKPGSPYDNEVDLYRQTHYQFFYNRFINERWQTNVTLFLTRGKGYYEQYKAERELSDYGIEVEYNNQPLTEADLIRRLYLDNYYGGGIFSLQYQSPKRDVTIGGGRFYYDGKHYGIVEALALPEMILHHRWYNNTAYKNESTIYTKWTEKINRHWYSYIDLQLRQVSYDLFGFRDAPTLTSKNDYLFFNPKVGFTYVNGKHKVYTSIAHARKEPNRDDFEAGALQQPKAESMIDWETGYTYQKSKMQWGVNVYYMRYRDQLVLTGKINDVGAYTRTNIPESYRLGVELETSYQWHPKWKSAMNLSLSQNKIKDFTGYMDDYDNGGQLKINYGKTDISFSPSTIGSWSVTFEPTQRWQFTTIGKYVGAQYMDNTSNKNSRLGDYYVQNLMINYHIPLKKIPSLMAYLHIQNIFNNYYEPNGYSFSYIYNQQKVTENYYFPMVPIQIFGGFILKL